MRWRRCLPSRGPAMIWAVTVALLLFGSLWPAPSWYLLRELLSQAVTLLPVVLIAAALAGLLALGRVSEYARAALGRRVGRGVLLGSLAGAVTPVCGLGVMPLIASLLRRGVPLPAVMAFWVSSPVTDPGMFAVTAALLGLPFALAKTAAAFGIGLLAGFITWSTGVGRDGNVSAVMRADAMSPAACGTGGQADGAGRRFLAEFIDTGSLVARWLMLALVLEVLMQRHIPTDWIEWLAGDDRLWAIPAAAVVGAPLYLDGYAALPLVRGLVELGLSSGAAMALLISGAAVSLYAAVAVYSLVRPVVFALYVSCAVVGAMIAGLLVAWLGITIELNG